MSTSAMSTSTATSSVRSSACSPFGGEGLSGTGPKAGGPLYMTRLLSARPADVMARALASVAASADASVDVGSGVVDANRQPHSAIHALGRWATDTGDIALRDLCGRFAAASRSGEARVLRGPTGERNLYSLLPREAVLCLAQDDADRLVQLAAVLAVGSQAVWPATAADLLARLPVEVRDAITLTSDWMSPATRFDAVIHHGNVDELGGIGRALAERRGAIVGVQGLRPGETGVALERLVVERSLSVNTAAAGGNASLMTLGEGL